MQPHVQHGAWRIGNTRRSHNTCGLKLESPLNKTNRKIESPNRVNTGKCVQHVLSLLLFLALEIPFTTFSQTHCKIGFLVATYSRTIEAVVLTLPAPALPCKFNFLCAQSFSPPRLFVLCSVFPFFLPLLTCPTSCRWYSCSQTAASAGRQFLTPHQTS